MIKLAYNKEKPNLVFEIDRVEREAVGTAGIVEKYVGTLVDTSTTPDTDTPGFKVPVIGFESNWNEVPTDLGSTGNINNQSKTVSPATTSVDVTPSSGYTGLDKVTVNAVTSAIDANIAATNIKSGVTILGVEGSVVELNGETANVTPTTAEQTITPTTGNGLTSVTVAAVTAAIDANIIAENIKSGVTILGVEGTYTGESVEEPEL